MTRHWDIRIGIRVQDVGLVQTLIVGNPDNWLLAKYSEEIKEKLK